jgi:DNA repair exonuclease SbcCD nuclease subunit
VAYVITSDWHLRSTRPRCRLDECWIETQRMALAHVASYAGQYKADVIVIGDIFHSTNETTNEVIGLVQEFALLLKETDCKLYILAGNHDLPQHNLDNIYRSAFQILLNSKNIFHLDQLKLNYGKYLMKVSAADFGAEDVLDAEIVFKHVLCFPENEKIPPSDKIVRPSELFAQFNNAKYIFTGDYHRQFVFNKGGVKKLLNPGCLLKQAADMIDYNPSVFLIDFKNGELSYKICPIPDNEKLVTDEYLETEKERNSRIEAFIERIKENEQVTFDFIENVRNSVRNNKFDADLENVIFALMEGV